MTKRSTEGAGNARALTQLSECEDLFSKYSPTTASEIAARACHRGGFTKVKAETIPDALEFIRALRSPDVDVLAEREYVERKAEAACAELIGAMSLTTLVAPGDDD